MQIHSALASNRRPPVIADEDISQLSPDPADFQLPDMTGFQLAHKLRSHLLSSVACLC